MSERRGERLRRLLAHPLTRGLALDDPRTTLLRREIVQRKRFLSAIYDEWHRAIAAELPPPPGQAIELGAGAGRLDRHVEGLRRSDLLTMPSLDLALDGAALPFADGSLRALAMVNVLHHLQSPSQLLSEAERCLRPGGVLVAIEPWPTPWSRFVYTRLHHEPFDPEAGWTSTGGPLSGGNGALPWILLVRDRGRFEREHPLLAVRRITPMMPLAYLASGGVGLRAVAPGWSYRAIRLFERATGLERRAAMFALLVLERSDRRHSLR